MPGSDIPEFPSPGTVHRASAGGQGWRTGLLITYLHLFCGYSLLDGACLLHFWLYPTSIHREFLFGWGLSAHFWLYPTSIQREFLFGWSLFGHFCLKHPSDTIVFLRRWSPLGLFASVIPSVLSMPIKGWRVCAKQAFPAHRIWQQPKKDGEFMPGSRISHHPYLADAK